MTHPQAAWLALQTVAYVVLGGACLRIVGAGRLEAAGNLEGARARARPAGLVAATAAAAATAGWSLRLPAIRVDAWVLIGALTMLSGTAALLAGLSGKPRPSGWIAALLWASSSLAATWTIGA